MKKYYGSIEAGGTKFVCAVGDEAFNIVERIVFPTTTPQETMPQVITFFQKYATALKSIGIGSFGPIDLQKNSTTYGFITSTPKIPWQNFDFLGELKQYFSLPLAWTTDVNAAAYGEYVIGSGQDVNSLVYYTIGTGIGGGAIQNDQLIEGFSHPEMGHMQIKPHPADDFAGSCPFHRDCLEGMAAGPAIEKRLGIRGETLAENDSFWEIEANYLAQCVYNTTLLLRPQRIILGGGVMMQQHLLEKVRADFEKLINGYVSLPNLKEYIVTPQLKNNAATIGCFALAKAILE